jgi:peptidoglycan/xylan/chitin deacetylase (PgdA/CDA1 family)
MKKPTEILIIAVFAITVFLVTGMFSANNLTKAQSTSGVVTIAFDDGLNSQFNNAFPLMQEHGFNGTYYIVTSFIGTGDYMNMSDLHSLQDAGNEIASHSAHHPNFVGLTGAQINYECKASQQLLQANGFPAINFAYPYGASNSLIDTIVLQYYRSAAYSISGGSLIPIPPTPMQMRLPVRVAGEAPAGYPSALAHDEAVVEQAQATNSWLIIFFHDIPATPPTNGNGIEQSDFASFLNYVGHSSVQVLTVNQALNLFIPPPSVIALPSSSTIDVGQDQLLWAYAWGGKSPYTYQWYQGGSAVGTNSTSYEFDPSLAGSFSIYVNVTDSSSVPVTVESNTASITVNYALVPPTASANHATLHQGQTSSLTSTAVTTGSSPYSYQWYSEAPGGGSYSLIIGATSSSYSFVTSGSTTTGSWSFELRVTDVTSAVVTSNSAVVNVNGAPIVSVSPSSWTMDAGQSEAFSATASGGSRSYPSYQWYVNGVVQSGQTASTVSFAPVSSSSYSITVTVTDSLGATSAQSSAVTVTVNAALATPALTPAPDTVDQGQTSSLTSTPVTTGTSPYMYQWFESAPTGSYVATGSNSASFSFDTSNATALGSWSFILQVTDNMGEAVNSSAVSATVNPTVSASAGVGGDVSPAGNVSVNYGDDETFTTKAYTGYYIIDLTVNESSVGAVSFHTLYSVDGKYVISVMFAPTPSLLYVIAATVAVVAIVAGVLVSRKGRRGKSAQKTHLLTNEESLLLKQQLMNRSFIRFVSCLHLNYSS